GRPATASSSDRRSGKRASGQTSLYQPRPTTQASGGSVPACLRMRASTWSSDGEPARSTSSLSRASDSRWMWASASPGRVRPGNSSTSASAPAASRAAAPTARMRPPGPAATSGRQPANRRVGRKLTAAGEAGAGPRVSLIQAASAVRDGLFQRFVKRYKPLLKTVDGRLCAVRQVQLGEDVRDVRLDGLLADVEGPRDLLVRAAPG